MYQSAKAAIEPHTSRLLAHPVYSNVQNRDEIQKFMEIHVFAVWDFMCLVMTLRRALGSGSGVLWLPPRYPVANRMINEIVLGEESDRCPSFEAVGQLLPVPHSTLYRRSMLEVGANTAKYDKLLANVAAGLYPMTGINVDPRVRQFVQDTLLFCAAGLDPSDSAVANLRDPTIAAGRYVLPRGIHVTAAAFLFGREAPIPDMFKRFLVSNSAPKESVFLRLYMERHIEVDQDEHGPMAQQLLEELCGTDSVKWKQVAEVAIRAIEARISLWDAILNVLAQPQTDPKTDLASRDD